MSARAGAQGWERRGAARDERADTAPPLQPARGTAGSATARPYTPPAGHQHAAGRRRRTGGRRRALHHASSLVLRLLYNVLGGQDGAGGHARRLHGRQHLLAGMGRHVRLNHLAAAAGGADVCGGRAEVGGVGGCGEAGWGGGGGGGDHQAGTQRGQRRTQPRARTSTISFSCCTRAASVAYRGLSSPMSGRPTAAIRRLYTAAGLSGMREGGEGGR